MSNQQTYSLMDKLAGEGRRRFASGSGGGAVMLDLAMLLSAVLSAIFFWSNSKLVFVNVWPPLALVLGLLVGLVPAEGAFFGWKKIRATKQDLTRGQLTATTTGVIASIACALFSTLSLFVASFTYVPDEIAEYSSWLVFLALSLPVMAQVVIYAWYTIEERSVKENHEHAKLSAMGFDAYIRAEAARMTAIIKGMELELNRQLESYGNRVGAGEAGELLRDGNTQLLNMGNREQELHTPLDNNGVTLFDLAHNRTGQNGAETAVNGYQHDSTTMTVAPPDAARKQTTFGKLGVGESFYTTNDSQDRHTKIKPEKSEHIKSGVVNVVSDSGFGLYFKDGQTVFLSGNGNGGS